MIEEDDLLLADGDELAGETGFSVDLDGWKVLVVDDDPEVHTVTSLALDDVTFMERPLRFYNAYAASEAELMLRDHPDMAVILLDVVMETDDAGLVLARKIRGELGLRAPRIILRTGQPGLAPERSIILRYDINDYKAKTELTHARLFTSVIGALRSYCDLLALQDSERGLKVLVEHAAKLYRCGTAQEFCEVAAAALLPLVGLTASSALAVCDERGVAEPWLLAVAGGNGDLHGWKERAANYLHGATRSQTVPADNVVAGARPLLGGGWLALAVERDDACSDVIRAVLDLLMTCLAGSYQQLALREQLAGANRPQDQQAG